MKNAHRKQRIVTYCFYGLLIRHNLYWSAKTVGFRKVIFCSFLLFLSIEIETKKTVIDSFLPPANCFVYWLEICSCFENISLSVHRNNTQQLYKIGNVDIRGQGGYEYVVYKFIFNQSIDN